MDDDIKFLKEQERANGHLPAALFIATFLFTLALGLWLTDSINIIALALLVGPAWILALRK